jgi:hypothetical protein
LAKVARPQINRPIAFVQLQVANDRLDGEPVLRWQFVSRSLQTHASTSCQCVNQERDITSRRPAEDHMGFNLSLAHQVLRQLPCRQRSHLFQILSADVTGVAQSDKGRRIQRPWLPQLVHAK